MAEKTKGFDSQTVGFLFSNGMKSQLEHITEDDDIYSDDNYSDEMVDDAPLSEENNQTIDSFKTK